MTQAVGKDAAYWAKSPQTAAVSDTEEIVCAIPTGDITVYRIRFASGFDIWGLPSRAAFPAFETGAGSLSDEAAYVDDLARLIKAAMALLMWGGSVSILSTHNGEDNAFNRVVKRHPGGKTRLFPAPDDWLDDALADGLYHQDLPQSQGKPWTREAEDRWRRRLITDGEERGRSFSASNRSSGAYTVTSAMIEACMADGVTP